MLADRPRSLPNSAASITELQSIPCQLRADDGWDENGVAKSRLVAEENSETLAGL
jgi:hypothetical protein